MKKYNVNQFDQITYFLGGVVKVNSLEDGAKRFGGATQIGSLCFSNCEASQSFFIEDHDNVLQLFVPSTLHDKYIDNSDFVGSYMYLLDNVFDCDITSIEARGAWYSDELKQVIYEDVTILTLRMDEVSEHQINELFYFAQSLKDEMQQEAISVAINKSLCLI